jgi:solute carrier family 25 citrate transporter 1
MSQSKAPGAPKLPFTGILDGMAYTVRTHGFLALYDGLSVTLLFSIPKAGIRFGGNAYCKQLLMDEKGKLNMGE